MDEDEDFIEDEEDLFNEETYDWDSDPDGEFYLGDMD
jgi:hypothetical protein